MYELIDSGEGEKLERFGDFVLRRPDPQALWGENLPKSEWNNAHARFDAKWRFKTKLPDRWRIELHGLDFWIKPTPFKHVGVFPEQISNWEWMEGIISKASGKVSILNLFGYTGGATLAALKSGASVTHVDSSKTSVTWAKDNAILSGLEKSPARWIVDDAKVFVKREAKRGVKYDGIVMDPPSFGRGAKGEVWKIENDLLPLMHLCWKILSDKPLFFLLNGYASGYSHFAYRNCLLSLTKDLNGLVESGELGIKESGAGRILPAGIFSRWH